MFRIPTILSSASILLIAMSAGCATVVNGTTQTIPVTSSPSEATLIVDGSAQHTTPCNLVLSRKSGHILEFKKDGYEPLKYQITTKMSGAVAGNILAGGLIGVGIDAASGASNNLVPEAVNVVLTKIENPEPDPPKQIAEKVAIAPCNEAVFESRTPTEPISIAVVDFAVGMEMEKTIGLAMGDICRGAIQQRSQRFVLLDRENMVSILGEQDLTSVIKCDETKCLVQYGKTLKVQKMMYGRITSLGSTYVVYLSITDVETSRIDAAITEQVAGRPESIGAVVPGLVCQALRQTITKNELLNQSDIAAEGNNTPAKTSPVRSDSTIGTLK